MKKNIKNIPLPTYFGKNLKLLRKLKGVSQQELAKNVGLSRNNVASYESGTVEPNAKAFLRIAHYLDTDPSVFLSIELEGEDLHELIEINHHDDTISEFVTERLSSFIKSTSESTKILEAYRAFYQLSDLSDLPADSETAHLRNQVMELFQQMLDTNWGFIQHINTHEEE
ncbi:MAG: helix-turn-helix transcriptional regulator [Saprospiraceae bacterium]|nr:helix-turn-helix transcriptional regulator [Saprospiraceae bacterium]